MSRTVAEKKDFTFIGGLNTEAGFQTFPENTWLDGDNVTPNADGSITRRTKLDLEDTYQVGSHGDVDANKQFFAYNIHRWDAAGGDGNVTLIVVQQGDHIRFYGNDQASISHSEKGFAIDLNTYSTGTGVGLFGSSPIQTTVGNGKLIIVSEDTDPILVEYDPLTDTITVTRLVLQIRDFEGLDDGLAPDNRPNTLSAKHHYNLLNQGWTDTNITAYNTADTPLYPSNAQIWTEGKDTSDVFSPAQLDKQFFGTSLAPRGHFILNVFSRDRSTVSGVGGITVETELSRCTTTAFFAGRAWYAGIRSTTVGSWILFSQITTQEKSKYAKCYQSGDPTAEFTSDLVASDGGVIVIPDAGDIVKLVPSQDSLLVFAQNGVWQIDGGASGFAADVYHVHKVCPFGSFAPESIIEIETGIVYWSIGDIFMLQRSDAGSGLGDFVVKSISFNKIQTLYDDIPVLAKQSAQGFYDIESKRIFWMYSPTLEPQPDGTIIDRYKKNKMLVLDTRLSSFYTYTVPDVNPLAPVFIVGGLLTSISSGTDFNTFNVLVTSGDNVIVTSTANVVTNLQFTSGAITSRVIKFLTLINSGGLWFITFADFTNTDDAPSKFFDWNGWDGTGIEPSPLPFLTTGYATGGDGTKTHQAPYILTFMKRTETSFDANLNAVNQSSCTMQGRWDWTDDAAAGHWTRGEEVYRHRRLFVPTNLNAYQDGYPVVVAKTKVRGQGKALSIKYTSASGKDMQIIGWSVLYNADTSV